MRIGVYAPLKAPDHPNPSGDRTMARLLQAALHQAGVETELISRLRMYDRGDAHRQRRLVRLAHRCAERSHRLAPTTPFDAILTYHCYHKAPDVLGRRLAALWNLPYVLVEASISPKHAHGPWGVGYAEAMMSIRAADVVLAMSEVDVRGLRPFLAVETGLIRLAPFTDRTPPYVPRQRLPGRPVELLTVAMMRQGAKRRSYTILIDALERSLEVGIEWRWTVVGDGAERAAIEAAASVLGDRTRFVGAAPPEALPALYQAADLFVWPAIDEAYGMVLLEAQAHGLPVLAGRTHGVPEIVVAGETGLLTEIADVRAFACGLQTLLGDPAALASMGRAAALHVRERHSLRAAAVALKDAFADASVRHALREHQR